MTYCSSCGARVAGPFCGECGTPASTPDPAASASAPDRPSTPAPADDTEATTILPVQAGPVSEATTALPLQAEAGTDLPVEPEPGEGIAAGSVPSEQPDDEPTTVLPVQDDLRSEPVGGAKGAAPGSAAALPPEAATAASWKDTGPDTRSRRRAPLVAGAAAVLVAALAGAGWATGLFGARSAGPTVIVTQTVAPSADAASAPAAETSAVPDTSSAAPSSTEATASATTTPAALSDEQAYANLERVVAEDKLKNPVRNQWVAQVASKYEGIVDTSQRPTPFTLVDIWTEIERWRNVPEYGSQVRVVHLGDWAGTSPHNPPMWVTFVDIDAGSKAAVTSWCEARFEQRGKALLNICYPRQMRIS